MKRKSFMNSYFYYRY